MHSIGIFSHRSLALVHDNCRIPARAVKSLYSYHCMLMHLHCISLITRSSPLHCPYIAPILFPVTPSRRYCYDTPSSNGSDRDTAYVTPGYIRNRVEEVER